MTTGLGATAPKYQRIADALRQAIRRGEYKAGDRLPAETALVERFKSSMSGVSLPTVRQALGVLQAEDLLERRQGIGTFVKENRRLQRRSRWRYGRARADGKLLTCQLRHEISFAGRVPAPAHIAEAMGVDEGAELVVRRRVLFDKETGRPEEIEASFIALDIAGRDPLGGVEGSAKGAISLRRGLQSKAVPPCTRSMGCSGCKSRRSRSVGAANWWIGHPRRACSGGVGRYCIRGF